MVDNFHNNFRFRFNNDFFQQPIETDNFVIYQIGDLFCDCDTVIEKHYQNMQIELSFVENGVGTMSSNNIPTNLVQGDIYLSLDGDEHSITSNNTDTLRYFYIALNIKPQSRLAPIADYLAQHHKNPTKRIFPFKYIFTQMSNILSEITYLNEYHIALIDSNLCQILVSLYRNSTNQLLSLNKYQTDDRNGMVFNIAHYINNNLCAITNLNALAEKFSYNYSYISKRFKQVMHMSMHTYFQEKKLNYAKQLLTQEHKSVTKVAEMLNYSSIHNFSRAFKIHFSMSPLQMIENNKKSTPPRKINLNNSPLHTATLSYIYSKKTPFTCHCKRRFCLGF